MPFHSFAMASAVCSVAVPKCRKGYGHLRLFSLSSMSSSVIKRSSVDFSRCSVHHYLALFLCPSSSAHRKRLLHMCRRCFVMDGTTRLVLGRYTSEKISLRSLPRRMIVRVGSARPSVMVPRLVHLLLREKFSVSRTVSIMDHAYTCAGRAVLTRTLRG